jgi:hypothetical protein
VTTAETRWVRTVHELSGRVRLRLGPVPIAQETATAVAEALARRGVGEVEVNRRTGSILCKQSPVGAADLTGVVREAVPGAIALAPGERPPTPPRSHARSVLARNVAQAFQRMDAHLLEATGGRLDLGTAATFAFVTAGAVEVAATRRLPVPPWFNLAWWGVRTFITFERDAGRDEPSEPPNGADPTVP